MPPGPTELQKDLQTLAVGLKQLEAEYNMFFSGRLPRPPWETRSRVEGLVKKLDRLSITNVGERFQFDSMQRRFMKFLELWDRGLRTREEGRQNRFGSAPPKAAPKPPPADHKVVHVTTFQDPMRELDKLHGLYDSLMDARRDAGEDVVPFHRFAALVKDQVAKAKSGGSDDVAFRVTVTDGKVNFTVRGGNEGEQG